MILLLFIATLLGAQAQTASVPQLQVTGTMQIPTGTLAPTSITPSTCLNGQLYLQQPTTMFPIGDLWRCAGAKWVSEHQLPPLGVHRTIVEDGGALIPEKKSTRKDDVFLAVVGSGLFCSGFFIGIYASKKKHNY